MASNSWLQLTPEELEKQYQPSKWVKRVPPNEAVAEFVGTISEQAARARETLGCCAEVRYGPGPEQRYRVLGTDVPDDAPLAVYIHGGYWQDLSLETSDGPALGFHQLGCRTVVLGYDLAPMVTMDQIVQQVREAGKRILTLAKELGSRFILLSGHSAGSQLAAMLLADWSKLAGAGCSLVGAVVHVSGVFDLAPLTQTTINEPLKMDSLAAGQNSPLRLCSLVSNLAHWRHIVLVGENDSSEFQRQSREYSEALSTLGCETHFHLVSERDHFDLCEALGQPGSEVLDIVLRDLKAFKLL